MKLYKATRRNGQSFYDSSVVYEVGKTVSITEGARPNKPQCCEAGVLHASNTPGEVLVGGSWPCRLFEVTGKPVCGLDKEHPHKAGFFELKVVRELPAWQAFGPNGKLIVALINRIAKLTVKEASTMAAAWDAAWAAARAAAWDAAWDAALAAARAAAWDAAWDAAWAAARAAARAAAWDAALAIVVKDKISKKQFDILYGPLGEVIKLRDLVNPARSIK